MTTKRFPSWEPSYRSAYYAKRKEGLNLQRREAYASSPEKRAAHARQVRQYRADHPEKFREYDRQRKARSLVYRAKVQIGACLRCRYNRYPGALQWAHVDASTKTAEPSWLLRASDDRAYEELQKCVLICANCHWEEIAGLWVPSSTMLRVSNRLLLRVMAASPVS